MKNASAGWCLMARASRREIEYYQELIAYYNAKLRKFEEEKKEIVRRSQDIHVGTYLANVLPLDEHEQLLSSNFQKPPLQLLNEFEELSEHYRARISYCQDRIKELQQPSIPTPVLYLLLAVVGASAFTALLQTGTLTGLLVRETVNTAGLDIGMGFYETGIYQQQLDARLNITGVKVSGAKYGSGDVIISALVGNATAVRYDSRTAGPSAAAITGYVVANASDNGTVDNQQNATFDNASLLINASQPANESNFTAELPVNESLANDTYESISQPAGKYINISITSLPTGLPNQRKIMIDSFNSSLLSKDNLCIQYDIFSAELGQSTGACFGSESCCALTAKPYLGSQWEMPWILGLRNPGQVGSNNLVTARAIYYDSDNISEMLTSDIAIYNLAFADPPAEELELACKECSFAETEADSITLLINISGNASFVIDSLTYTYTQLEELAVNETASQEAEQLPAEVGRPV